MNVPFASRLPRIRRLSSILLLGFSSGFPLALTGSTLQAWMSNEKVDLSVIGAFSLVGIPYSLKFLWAPLMDRFVPPFLGRRTGWILVMQFAMFLSLFSLSLLSPAHNLQAVAGLAVLVAFWSASQDIAIDAYRTDVLPADELGLGASLNIMGYRLAMLFSGALALALADTLPWARVYQIMALCVGIGLFGTLIAPRPKIEGSTPRSIREAVVQPLLEFLKRKGALEILAFVVFYKMDVVIASALLTPFLLETGFSKTEISVVFKGFGFFATILGTLAGGALMTRWSMKRSLWTFGILQGISGVCFVALALIGPSRAMMALAITAENFLSGMGTAAFGAFLMSICDRRFSATQFALLSSFMALTRVLGGAPTGWLAQTVGWPSYYLISIFAMVPGLLLLSRYDRWTRPRDLR